MVEKVIHASIKKYSKNLFIPPHCNILYINSSKGDHFKLNTIDTISILHAILIELERRAEFEKKMDKIKFF